LDPVECASIELRNAFALLRASAKPRLAIDSQRPPIYDARVTGKTTPEVVGQYEIHELLGRGGMATVHRAETVGASGFRRTVALKRLHPYLTTDSDLVKAFIHEARLASNLRHSNCAQTYDLGKVGDTYFIAMEYVAGATVAQIIKQCNSAAGLIPIPIALNLWIQILDGLDHAHNLADESGKPLNIIHRDVSPANLIVSNTGVLKIIDFGIAKAEGKGDQTQAGLIKGKFGYVAPEYTYGMLDSRADLFAVGVIAHEMLTGMRLFDGKDSFETIQMLREGPIQPPSRWRPEVSRDLDDIVMTALMRDPGMRWQSASAMRIALANLARDAKLEVTNQQVFEWVEWAFMQETRKEETALGRALFSLAEPSTGTKELSVEDFLELDDASKTTVRPSATFDVPPRRSQEIERRRSSANLDAPIVGAGMLQRHYPTKAMSGIRKGVWILLIALFALAATAAITYFVMDYFEYEVDFSVLG
jgi:serine/threonine protein kinase